MEDLATPEFMPMLNTLKGTKCNSCGSTFDDIINTGMLGCQDCYDFFEDRLDPIIRRLQGSNRHVGRIGKIIDSKIDEKNKKESDVQSDKEKVETKKIKKLKEQLKKAISEEKYEEAAKIRDEIKSLESKE